MTRTVDENFQVVNGVLVIPTDLEALRQRSVQHLRFILGESFIAPDNGTPYFPAVLGTFQDPELSSPGGGRELESFFSEEILSASVSRQTVDSDTRRMKLGLRVSSIYGEMDIEA